MVTVPLGAVAYVRHVARTGHFGRIRRRPEPPVPAIIDLREHAPVREVPAGAVTPPPTEPQWQLAAAARRRLDASRYMTVAPISVERAALPQRRAVRAATAPTEEEWSRWLADAVLAHDEKQSPGAPAGDLGIEI